MKHKCKAGSPAAILMGRYADGGDTMPVMETVGSRRAAPNLNQHFSRGGSAMEMEDKLKGMGVYSTRGSEMDKEDRRRARGGAMHASARRSAGKTHYATGGDIGTNTGSSIARRPGQDALGLKKGGFAMKRAMGGAGKTRKNYPFT